eukprot:767076-Hanusia_phi.AAC.1
MTIVALQGGGRQRSPPAQSSLLTQGSFLLSCSPTFIPPRRAAAQAHLSGRRAKRAGAASTQRLRLTRGDIRPPPPSHDRLMAEHTVAVHSPGSTTVTVEYTPRNRLELDRPVRYCDNCHVYGRLRETQFRSVKL